MTRDARLRLTAAATLVDVSVLAALLRWSWWWPHPDMRQLWAHGAVVLSALLASVGAAVTFRGEDGRGRRVFVGLVVLAVVLGAVVGFAVLREATAPLR